MSNGTPQILNNASGSKKCNVNVRIHFTQFFSRFQYTNFDKSEMSNLISMDELLEQTKKLGGDESDLIDVIYDTDRINQITGQYYRTLVDTKSFILANINACMVAAQRISIYGRLALVEDFINWKVVEQENILEFILEQSGNNSKYVQEKALWALRSVPKEAIEAPTIELLGKSSLGIRESMVKLLIQNGSEAAKNALREHYKKEKTVRILAAIDNYLSIEDSLAQRETGEHSYTALDGSVVVIPPPRSLNSSTFIVYGDKDKEVLTKLVNDINKEREKRDEGKRFSRSHIPVVFVDILLDLLNQYPTTFKEPYDFDRASSDLYSHQYMEFLCEKEVSSWIHASLERQSEKEALELVVHVGNYSCYRVEQRQYSKGTFEYFIRKYLSRAHADLRNLELIAQTQSRRDKGYFLYIIDKYVKEIGVLDDALRKALWPYVAEQFDAFDNLFSNNNSSLMAIHCLQVLPKPPMHFLGALLELATSTTKLDDAKEARSKARKMLSNAVGVDERLIALLNDSKQAIRIGAAEILGELNAVSAIKPLRQRLKKERSEVARAQMLSTLSLLGEDLSDFIGPQTLWEEAEKGLKTAKLDKMNWLSMESLTNFHYKDGSKVMPGVLIWWLYQAFKLKQPEGNKLFDMYLELLSEQDAERFSSWIFDSWIRYDTEGRYKEKYSPYVYPNSGAATKGILALAKKTPPLAAADRVRDYLKNYGSRTSQASSLLQVLANIGDPLVLQVIVAAATRLKQKGVQHLAGELITKIADEHVWSFDEFSDRTIPVAGLDDNGLLDLPCGQNLYEGFLADGLTLGLKNLEGKVVKALPSGTDDETKASRKLFSASKRELKQVVMMQSARLYESLCVEKVWNKEDWLRDYRKHPIMKKITERVVWLGLDEDEVVKVSFRPTAEGDYTDVDDNTVALDDYSMIKLAHGALLDEDIKKCWLQHLKDYEVKTIFPQFERPELILEKEQENDTSITDREGWVTDTFTIRSFAKKFGYDRGEVESAFFSEYCKTFKSAGLVAVIQFSGNVVAEEKIPAALMTLSFKKLLVNNEWMGDVTLSDIPPVLLSECWNDYRMTASRATYDEDWKSKMRWMSNFRN